MSTPPHSGPPHRDPTADAAAMHDVAADVTQDADGAAYVEDRLVELVGRQATTSLDESRPGFVALCEWLAAEAAHVQSPMQLARSAARAVRFADAVLARRALARVAERGMLHTPSDAPVERVTRAATSLADAVALAHAHDCAPMLDLRVAAGDGRALWEQACDRWVELPPDTPAGRYLALGVAGDSMLPLLAPGDTLLVRLDETPVPDTLVVARTPDDGYVVKQVGRVTTQHVELRSLNPAYAPFRVGRTAGAVLGTVVLRWRRER